MGLRGGPDEEQKDEDASDEDAEDVAAMATTHDAAEPVTLETEEKADATCAADRDPKHVDMAVASTSGQASNMEPIVHTDSDNDDSDNCPELEDLSLQNKEYRPFRDEASQLHINEHLLKGETSRSRHSDSVSSASSMDPALIKRKVKSQAKKREARQFARRVRKSGEAAVVTKARRDNWDNIKQSTGPDWF